MTSPLWGKYCDGGHYCSAPKECCTLGCCYHTLPTNGVLSLWFLGHWYFWALVMAAFLGVLCACSMWKRCWRRWRLWRLRRTCACRRSHSCSGIASGREDRASEPDSTGSCYAPPHYSRCNSFHHAPPPPYNEVTSKPDLYPLVISYNGDTGMKRGGSASYLMVQYFRNYILRPSGSISATSTIDSLSSSFICNAANEANTVIPPPYSCTGSLEGFTFTANSVSAQDNNQMVHSASSLNCNDFQQNSSNSTHHLPNSATISNDIENPSQYYSVQNSPKYQSNSSTRSSTTTAATTTTTPSSGAQNSTNSGSVSNKQKNSTSNNYSPVYVHNKTTSFINNMPNTRLDLGETILNTLAKIDRINEIENRNSVYQQQQSSSDSSHNNISKRLREHAQQQKQQKRNIISAENSIDSSETSQGDEHNFSELLNLSVCAPSNGNINCDNILSGIGENMAEQQTYSIANSVTVSDISSLANLGTPDSPPRATSPTVEIRELLDKIQQLPQPKSPAPEEHTQQQSQQTQHTKSTRFFKNKSKTLYMPLNTSSSNNNKTNTIVKLSPNGASSKYHSGSIFGGPSGIFSYKSTKGWLSRSAPTTPCGNFVPLFPSQRKSSNMGPKSHTGSKSKMDDASALLTECDGSDDDQQHNNGNVHL